MTAVTALDAAHAAMIAEAEAEEARRAFFGQVAAAELFLLLDREASGDRIEPRIFDTGDGRFALAFDLEERVADFAGNIAPYAALSGRTLATMLAGQGVGLGLNLEVAPSAMLIPAEGLDWLAEQTAQAPAELSARIRELRPPGILPEILLGAIDAKLAAAGGLAGRAYLAGVEYQGGAFSHLLAFVDARRGAEGALACAVNEALAFSGLDAGALDVTFVAGSDALVAALERVALRFDLPETPARQKPGAPGRDPDRPPKLR